MNTRELERHIAAGSGLDRAQARAALRSFAEGVASALEAGESVSVRGVGSFRAVRRRGRRVLHPRTGDEIVLPSRKRPHFVPGKRLRDVVGALRVVADPVRRPGVRLSRSRPASR